MAPRKRKRKETPNLKELPARVVIEGVTPEIDGGRFPIKRTVDEKVLVEADIFADGHDALSGVLLHRHESEPGWTATPLEFKGNDRWQGEFQVPRLGTYRYTLKAWIDPFKTWRRDMAKRIEASQEVSVDLLIGAGLIEAAASRAGGETARELLQRVEQIRSPDLALAERIQLALEERVAALLYPLVEERWVSRYDKELSVVVDRQRARFGAWYEIFPRSWGAVPGRHATFREVESHLPAIAQMGFDVLYLPPIHPIGRLHRKGKNNAPEPQPGDPGSPWAIGSEEGGHKAVHPQLGTLDDFKRFLKKAEAAGLEIALDIAFHCAPDHPYVKHHPSWFRWRPDRTVQYAENPPKKYEDIYPFDFESAEAGALWEELKGVVLFWLRQGVRIFRVDNPHTKPLPFWEWLIAEVKKEDPRVIFLAEAFTRPRIMYRLAKLGFTQSYTYFAWRNLKGELEQYFTELTRSQVREYYRPNLWPNTPDILTEYLQTGGPPAFKVRLVLAATLGASYGIYGPAFELCEATPREPGSEEYLDSEKYEIKRWDFGKAAALRGLIARLNQVRRENPALQSDRHLRFHEIDNPQMLCYSKRTDDRSNVILTVVNLDPHHTQSGWVSLDLQELGLEEAASYQMQDLLTDACYPWQGRRNFVELSPQQAPAHLFRLRHFVRPERDFSSCM